jgi:hypothetical protein
MTIGSSARWNRSARSVGFASCAPSRSTRWLSSCARAAARSFAPTVYGCAHAKTCVQCEYVCSDVSRNGISGGLAPLSSLTTLIQMYRMPGWPILACFRRYAMIRCLQKDCTEPNRGHARPHRVAAQVGIPGQVSIRPMPKPALANALLRLLSVCRRFRAAASSSATCLKAKFLRMWLESFSITSASPDARRHVRCVGCTTRHDDAGNSISFRSRRALGRNCDSAATPRTTWATASTHQYARSLCLTTAGAASVVVSPQADLRRWPNSSSTR